MFYDDFDNNYDDNSQNYNLSFNPQISFNVLNEMNDNPYFNSMPFNNSFIYEENENISNCHNDNLQNNIEEELISKDISNNFEYKKLLNNNKKKEIKEIKELKELKEISKSDIKTKYTTKQKKVDLIFQITKDKNENENKIKKNLGRKRKNDENNIESKHNKFSSDNIVRKIKAKLFDSILFLLNSSLKQNSKKMFLKIEQKIIKDINVNNNKILLKTKLKDIFSKNISEKLINYGLDYNRKVIQQIYKENIEIKTISILEKTFFECLEHFRRSKYYIELDGLEKEYNNAINYLKDKDETEEYINNFKQLVETFEEFYNSKKPRLSRKNTINYYYFFN